jgi:Acetyltransferase (GNAT) domain
MSTDELLATNELLNAELPDARYDPDARYLRWLYEENPLGPAYQRFAHENGVLVGHYALVPQNYRDATGPMPGAYSLHAVTRSGTQRKGLFISLAKEVYADAAADGRRLLTALPNEKSVGAGPKHLGWRLVGQMPVRLCFPTTVRTHDVETIDCTPELLANERFATLTADLDDYPVTGVTNSWTTESLRWRLARPDVDYVLHVGPEVIGISTRTVQRGIRAAVIMKLFPRGDRRGPLSSRAIIAAACRRHRAPVAVYGGLNEIVTVRGFEPPKRIRPSPLFWLVQTLQAGDDQDSLRVSTYEFLDVDAF